MAPPAELWKAASWMRTTDSLRCTWMLVTEDCSSCGTALFVIVKSGRCGASTEKVVAIDGNDEPQCLGAARCRE